MQEQLHAYYMILHAFTGEPMQLQSLHAQSVGPTDFEISGSYRPMDSPVNAFKTK